MEPAQYFLIIPGRPGYEYRVIRCESTREERAGVDKGRKGWSLLAMKMRARTVAGRGEDSLLSDPGPELRLGKEKEKEEKVGR